MTGRWRRTSKFTRLLGPWGKLVDPLSFIAAAKTPANSGPRAALQPPCVQPSGDKSATYGQQVFHGDRVYVRPSMIAACVKCIDFNEHFRGPHYCYY